MSEHAKEGRRRICRLLRPRDGGRRVPVKRKKGCALQSLRLEPFDLTSRPRLGTRRSADGGQKEKLTRSRLSCADRNASRGACDAAAANGILTGGTSVGSGLINRPADDW